MLAPVARFEQCSTADSLSFGIPLHKSLRAETESPAKVLSENRPPLHGFAGGTEWVIDARGCCGEKLCDRALILSICQSVVDDLGLKVVGQPQCHQFPDPAGVTALFLLSESHLACHTYPEHRFATFNLYCCRRRASWDWQRQLSRRLEANEVFVREIDRSIETESSRRREELR